jgi:hypothetical protein
MPAGDHAQIARTLRISSTNARRDGANSGIAAAMVVRLHMIMDISRAKWMGESEHEPRLERGGALLSTRCTITVSNIGTTITK